MAATTPTSGAQAKSDYQPMDFREFVAKHFAATLKPVYKQGVLSQGSPMVGPTGQAMSPMSAPGGLPMTSMSASSANADANNSAGLPTGGGIPSGGIPSGGGSAVGDITGLPPAIGPNGQFDPNSFGDWGGQMGLDPTQWIPGQPDPMDPAAGGLHLVGTDWGPFTNSGPPNAGGGPGGPSVQAGGSGGTPTTYNGYNIPSNAGWTTDPATGRPMPVLPAYGYYGNINDGYTAATGGMPSGLKGGATISGAGVTPIPAGVQP